MVYQGKETNDMPDLEEVIKKLRAWRYKNLYLFIFSYLITFFISFLTTFLKSNKLVNLKDGIYSCITVFWISYFYKQFRASLNRLIQGQQCLNVTLYEKFLYHIIAKWVDWQVCKDELIIRWPCNQNCHYLAHIFRLEHFDKFFNCITNV